MLRLKRTDFKSPWDLVEHMKSSPVEAESVDFVVEEILRAVKSGGDGALLKYNRQFGSSKSPLQQYAEKPLRVEKESLERALESLDPQLKCALERAAENIRAYHSHQQERDWMMPGPYGSELGMLVRPMERVALYVPGGTAAYPSTVLMNVIPAQLAGVEQIFILSPPGVKGEVHPTVLATAALLGIEEVYRVGGAQAVAAAAYGTESIIKADKIVGPGNKYVAAAKKRVYGCLDIDMMAGPSEVLIIADKNANPEWIAADLLAQAEHDEDARMILVTTEASLIDGVERALGQQQRGLLRQSITSKSLEKGCWAVEVENMESALEVANAVAPEHLELLVDHPKQYLQSIRHAGSVFLGPYSPEALGDYYAGTNHTLPTGGTARFSSPLGVYDFIKRTAVTAYTAQALSRGADDIVNMAEAEGLTAHGQSIAIRTKASSNIKMSANENPCGLQDLLPSVWWDTLLPKLKSNRYPDETYLRLRAALSSYTQVPEQQIVCGNGSDELIRLLVESFTTELGTGVVALGPTFGEYARAAAHKGTAYKELPPQKSLKLNFTALKEILGTEKPELIFICNPNNPTGELIPATMIFDICDATKALVVVDEAYFEFGGESALGGLKGRTNLVVLRTLSKAFGLAGLRVGYAIGPQVVIETINARRMPYNVNVMAEAAAIYALENRDELLGNVETLKNERDRLLQALSHYPEMEVYPSAGNFILFKVKTDKIPAVLEALKAAGIEIRNYEQQDLQGCLRVSIGRRKDNDLFLNVMDQLWSRTTGRQIS